MITQDYINKLACKFIGGAIEVHKQLGPGLHENIYEKCLIHELRLNGFNIKSQITTPLLYKGIEMDFDQKLDMLVDDLVIIELKSVIAIQSNYEAQLLTFMKLLKISNGVLINLNCSNHFNEGQRTFVNEHFA